MLLKGTMALAIKGESPVETNALTKHCRICGERVGRIAKSRRNASLPYYLPAEIAGSRIVAGYAARNEQVYEQWSERVRRER